MHPSSLHILIASMVDEHDVNVISYKDEPHFLVHQIAAACGSKDPGQIVKLVRGDDEYLDEKHIVTFTGDDLAWLKAHSTTGNRDTHRGIGERVNSITAFTVAGLSLFLTKSHLPKGREVRAWLANQVMPAILKTGSYGQPQIEGPAPEPKPALLFPVDVKLAIADRMLAANDKAGAKKVLRAAAVEVGVDFGRAKRIEATPTAQLELPLVPAAPTPEPTPTSPRPKWLRDAPPDDGNDWPAFVRAWLSKYGFGAIVTSADLLQLGIVVPDSPNDAGRASRLGRALHKRIDTVIAGCRITHRNSTVRGYALQKA